MFEKTPPKWNMPDPQDAYYGACIGGPHAGQMREHGAPVYEVAICPPAEPLSHTAASPKKHPTFRFERYFRHKSALHIPGQEDVNFWIHESLSDIVAAFRFMESETGLPRGMDLDKIFYAYMGRFRR